MGGGTGTCRICASRTVPAGTVTGRFSGNTFTLRECHICGFGCIADPLADASGIYDEAYYAGRGADPLVEYASEVADPSISIRRFEWAGITAAVNALVPLRPETRWLDMGCGLGGLVSWLRALGVEAHGAEEGWAADRCAERGIPIIDPLGCQGAYDVITCVEVIEHVVEPIPFLETVRALLRPGGLLWLTTGNSRRWAGRLQEWNYVIPEIHVSFFQPHTMSIAMTRAGLVPREAIWIPGYTDIVRYKILKNVRAKSNWVASGVIPWGMVTRLTNRWYGAMDHPWAFAPT